MASKDKSSPGLLSKVVRFVRNSTGSWSESEPEAERESAYSKQMLKEMIERKRRNDFVRRREFDMLRKLRRSEALAGHELGGRPSFFQSSLPSRPDDRATTLRKIDEIEAQMSMQWWKTKHVGGAAGDAQRTQTSGPMPLSSHLPLEPLAGGPAPGASGSSYIRTAPQDLPKSGPLADAEPDALLPVDFEVFAGKPASAPAPLVQAPPAPAPAAGPAPSGAESLSAPSAFSASKVFAIDVEEFAHDPELEEAAIRFANGDDAGAEAGLLEVLRPQGPRVDHEETWLALFDFYRVTGRQERFDTAAMEFANRFGRSAPQWFSMPQRVEGMAAPVPQKPAAGAPHWTCPPVFGPQSLPALNAAVARAEPPWHLDWSKLTAIAETAVEPLAAAFARWATQPVQLRFSGADVLERVLRDGTPSGDRGTEPARWKLRLEALRVMHRPDEFELVALDYCVTYEVSPPSWEGSRCHFKALQAEGHSSGFQTIVGEAFRDSLTSTTYGDTAAYPAQSQLSAVATVELAGEVLGDGSGALKLLDEKMGEADVMVVACDRLMRIDFTAAGTLLNWVMARQGEGRQVQFVEVHRLVAAFFNVIGISEHARVIVRQD